MRLSAVLPRDSSPPSLFSIAGAWKQSRDRRFPSPASTSAGSNREAGSNRDSSPPSLFSPAPASSKLLCFTHDLRSQSYFPSMTKIVGTLGPKSRSVEVISRCLMAGMSGNFLLLSRFVLPNMDLVFTV
ncbi:hypothetical protein LXL04_024551 [Taraxacum kok-saghyz]